MSAPLSETSFYILLSVHAPNHGYGIMQDVEHATSGKVKIGPGTLYTAVAKFEKRGWIEVVSSSPDSRQKKSYQLTKLGREVVNEELIRLESALSIGRQTLGQNQGGNET